MARPMKQGLDYWPIDVNFLKDMKIRKIKKACGVGSTTILICLLSNIYGDHGYFVTWDEDMSFLIADEVGVSEGAVTEVVNKSLQVGFFNKKIYDMYKILTSKGIQERFIKASERRKQVEIIEQYCLINLSEAVNVYINSVNDDINSINGCSNEQSKVKKSKVNESKDLFVGTDVPTPPKKNKKVFKHDSVEYKSAKYLADKILEKNPNARVPKDDASLFKWCEHIDYILRIDKRPLDELRKVLAFAVKDSFWSENILSTKKLREKYDQLFMRMTGAEERKNRADKNTMPQPKKNRFNNYKGREWDYDKLRELELEYIENDLKEI